MLRSGRTTQWHYGCVDLHRVQNIWLTRVKCLHIAVKKTDIHASHVDNVEQGCDDHAPHRQQHPDQNVDWKQQVSQQEQVTSVR